MQYLTSEKGLTITSANHLANLAKETTRDARASLENISFLNVSIEIIDGPKKEMSKGLTSTDDLEELIQLIAEANSFCAWVREAIKEKNALEAKLENLTLEGFCQIKGLTIPTAPDFPTSVLEADIRKEFDVKELQNYLRLEAFAAAYGQTVHEGGSLSNARLKLFEKVSKPIACSEKGRDTILYTYTPSIPKEDVEQFYMQMQNKHREYNRQLNAIKYSITEKAHKKNQENQTKYSLELQKYNAEMKELNQQLSAYRINGLEAVRTLKIIVPKHLEGIVEKLNKLGK